MARTPCARAPGSGSPGPRAEGRRRDMAADWAWLRAAPKEQLQAYPPLVEGGVTLRERPIPPLAVTVYEQSKPMPVTDVLVDLRLAFVNALTLMGEHPDGEVAVGVRRSYIPGRLQHIGFVVLAQRCKVTLARASRPHPRPYQRHRLLQ